MQIKERGRLARKTPINFAENRLFLRTCCMPQPRIVSYKHFYPEGQGKRG